jgi:S-layer family protein
VSEGAGRGLLRLSGGVWTEDTTIPMYSSVFSLSPEALGEARSIGFDLYHNIGGVWYFEGYPPTISVLNGISLVPGRGGWAVGDTGTILKYNPLGPGQRYYDVPTTNTFYFFIECMATQNVISGYGDNTFRPNNSVTRGQLAKIVSNAAGFEADPGSQVFEDVPPGNTFYTWINRLSNHAIMGGYACGGEGEPCGTDNKPYFRTNNNATRGQISKIVSNAAGYNDPAGTQIFEDVPPDSSFYEWVQRLASRGIMGGYNCGGAGEPCSPDNKPYFRPNNNATRGQTSKIVANTFFPACEAASPTK